MFETRGIFKGKEEKIEAQDCVVEKVIRLSGNDYDRFAADLFQFQDFIRDNNDITMRSADGKTHCLLVVGDDRRDGILVYSSGYDYARYTALLPNAEAIIAAERYPALAELNRKLTGIVDIIAEHAGEGNADGRGVIDLQQWDDVLGIDLMTNGTLLNTVLRMLDVRPEIRDFELDKNELFVYRAQEPAPAAVDLTDPTVTRTDMYTYGYTWDGMIPLGKEKAMELFDAGREVFRLYENDAEGAINLRTEFDSFDGLFGVEDPAWKNPEHPQPFQVFIANRELLDKEKASGEWLALPSGADDLRGLFERIGVDRPSEGAFTVTAIRVPQAYLRDYVSKYDSLDELNMLASYLRDAEENGDLEKYNAILSSGIVKAGRGAAGLINLLDADNLACFELIDAKDVGELGRYYHRENNEKPDGASFDQYCIQCKREEGGEFTEWGYIKQKYNEFDVRYTGAVPDEYKIVGEALRGLRLKAQERGSDEKPSVMDQIKAARQSPVEPRETDAPKNTNKKKGEPDL